MKNKPPAGATLIARLKERRLQRDQEPPLETGDSGVDNSVLDAETTELQTAAESSAVVQISLATSKEHSPSTDLLHRPISIDDLRPTSDDYEALTDEIKLAGRFAAVGLIAQGLRLVRIHQAEIHKDRYGSFEDYCRREHQMSATYAYRLIRMAEMAENMAERGLELSRKNLPDPFEVLLHLGHRHLMALLPLPQEQAEEFLVKGIPLISSDQKTPERVPIDKATEKQIRSAFKLTTEAQTAETQRKSKDLSKLVKIMEEYAEWLESDVTIVEAEPETDLKRLTKRFRSAFERIANRLKS